MTNFADRYSEAFRRLLPSPFAIAIILTLLSFLLAVFLGDETIYAKSEYGRFLTTLDFWYQGLWSVPGLEFTVQMMLMLLLGHVLALSKPIDVLLDRLAYYCNTTARAGAIIVFSVILVSLINWGLGLVFGALFARKVGERAQRHQIRINYGFVGACGYVGLMVWHGGLSGSAPLKVADNGHLEQIMAGTNLVGQLPSSIPMSDTVFSTMNIFVTTFILIGLPLFAWFLGGKFTGKVPSLKKPNEVANVKAISVGAERIDTSRWIGLGLGLSIVIYAFFRAILSEEVASLKFINPNFINFCLLGLALLMHRSLKEFLSKVDEAVSGISGILIQFPLYFGILAIMKNAGLMTAVSEWIASHSSASSFPVFTMLGSGALNVFVPSGGGQWVVQGPIIIETAVNNHIPLSKCVMAMAYGDQLTNMMQPFWALPLLGITGLKAKEIVPYSLMFMVVGTLIYLVGLILF